MAEKLTATGIPPASFEIGVITLGEYLKDPIQGQKISAQQRLQEIIDAARLADAAGRDVFGVGEHHALDFVVSAVPVVLAAIAPLTKRILLTSAVTVIRRPWRSRAAPSRSENPSKPDICLTIS